MKYLIVGLGNIGPEYLFTRHNIGFMALDRLASRFEQKWEVGRYAYGTEIKHKGRTLCCIKPTTFMNLSGKAVNYWAKELKIPTENILVVTDDIALPYAKLRLKPKGSHGGHNGLRNIEELLGTAQYPRLRFGVGGNFPKGRQADYVLGNFESTEFDELPTHLDKTVEIILSFATLGIEKTMNNFNE